MERSGPSRRHWKDAYKTDKWNEVVNIIISCKCQAGQDGQTMNKETGTKVSQCSQIFVYVYVHFLQPPKTSIKNMTYHAPDKHISCS